MPVGISRPAARGSSGSIPASEWSDSLPAEDGHSAGKEMLRYPIRLTMTANPGVANRPPTGTVFLDIYLAFCDAASGGCWFGLSVGLRCLLSAVTLQCVDQPRPADGTRDQAQESRLAEVVVQPQRRAKDAAAGMSPGPGHRPRHPAALGREQHCRVGRETGPAIDLALGKHRFHALHHRMVPSALGPLDLQQTASPAGGLPPAQHLFGEVRPGGMAACIARSATSDPPLRQ